MVSADGFAAPISVPENGPDLGAVNRFPNNITIGNQFTAPKSCPFSGTKIGAANQQDETSFLVPMEPLFWVHWILFSGHCGTEFRVQLEPVSGSDGNHLYVVARIDFLLPKPIYFDIVWRPNRRTNCDQTARWLSQANINASQGSLEYVRRPRCEGVWTWRFAGPDHACGSIATAGSMPAHNAAAPNVDGTPLGSHGCRHDKGLVGGGVTAWKGPWQSPGHAPLLRPCRSPPSPRGALSSEMEPAGFIFLRLHSVAGA